MPLPDDLPPLQIDPNNPIHRTDRVKTGIAKLDNVLEGGLRMGYSYLVYGNLEDMRVFSWHLIEANNTKKTLYLTTEIPQTKLVQSAHEKYMNITSCFFIDMFTGGISSGNVIYMSLGELKNLKNIFKGLHSHYNKNFRVMIDNLDYMVNFGEDGVADEFIRSQFIEVKNFNSMVLVFAKKPNEDLRESFDAYIQFTGSSIIMPDIEIPINYKITDTGIEIT